MLNQTQVKMVTDQLTTFGEVTRNWCLQRYCSRLGALIHNLKKKGWTFSTSNREGDYVYHLVSKPQE